LNKLARDNKTLLKIITLNAYGFKNNMFYLNKLMEQYDILIVLETWIEENQDVEEFLFKKYDKKKYEVKASRDHKTGRAKGGIVVFVNEDLKTRFYKETDCVVYITLKGLVIFIAYLPVDLKINEYDYAFQLAKLKMRVQDYDKSHDVYIVGDLNADLKRKRSSNSNLLKKFLREMNFKVLDLENQSFNFTYHKGKVTSHIDHCLAKRRNPRIETVEILRDDDNCGDHLAIELTLEVRVDLKSPKDQMKTQKIKPKWKKLHLSPRQADSIVGRTNVMTGTLKILRN